MSIYRQFGVEPVINASGGATRLGGSPMPREVVDAFRQAATEPVLLEQLQAAASRQISEKTSTEAGLVTAGSAAGLTLGAAAILAGSDPGRVERLPRCDGFPSEFIIAREQRCGYDHAVRAAGGRLVEVGLNEIVSNAGVRRTECWEYEAAVTARTAGIVYVFSDNARPPLSEVVQIAQRHALPVLVDAAGELPPRANLRDIPASGADLVSFSGGKAIRGPQATGILCGRRDLIASAAVQMLDMDDHPELWDPPADFIDRSQWIGMPRHGLGRAMKVSKEEIVALLVALDLFASGAYDRQLDDHRRYLASIADGLSDVHAHCRLIEPACAEKWPLLEITIDQDLARSAFDVCRLLRSGQPPVHVGHSGLHDRCLIISPDTLTDASIGPLIQRLREELR